MSTSPDPKLIAELHQAERKRLFQLPDFPGQPPDDQRGVLLSDRIKHYCNEEHKLISPFDPDRLRPAGYALSVGRHYSIGGQWKALSDGMPLTIKPYQVAIIETFETLNMPRYLIGRWNIQTKRAYDGLLWVGGAQVDPGFRGYLCCPIYNLSKQTVTLNFRDTLAAIDFVTTTPYQEGECLPYDWAGRKKLTYLEYGTLESGIEREVHEFERKIEASKVETTKNVTEFTENTEGALRDIRSRIDHFLALIFTVVAVLFTGLGIVATTNQDERSVWNFPVLTASVALWFALRSSRSPAHDKWYGRPGFALAIVASIAAASLVFGAWEVRVSRQALLDHRQEIEAAIGDARIRSDTSLQALRRQIDELREAQIAKEASGAEGAGGRQSRPNQQ